VDDFDAYTTNKHAGNPVLMDTEKRDLYLRIAELEAEVKTLRKDAERYRWLRDVAPKGTGEIADIRSNHSTDEINAAIDAAREGK
jgi:hypothetical protein